MVGAWPACPEGYKLLLTWLTLDILHTLTLFIVVSKKSVAKNLGGSVMWWCGEGKCLEINLVCKKVQKCGHTIHKVLVVEDW